MMGKEAENYTDTEIEEIRDAQYQFAEIAFDAWMGEGKIKKSKLKCLECC